MFVDVMKSIAKILKPAVAALCTVMSLSYAVSAQTETLDQLFVELQRADAAGAQEIEQKIWAEWSKSGSASMDLLLERGREAMSAGNFEAAIEHFSALIDHAPEFAEGYNARATAYYQIDLYGPSVDDIRQVLARNPRHFGALSGLALIFEEIGMTDGALAAWREVQTLHPNREGVVEAIERLELETGGQSL